jgi:Na+:H+ antiporter, NhaA family
MSGKLSVRKEAWSGGDTVLARSVAQPLTQFLRQEASSSMLLLVATAAALSWANFGGDSYQSFWQTEVEVAIGSWHPLTHGGHGLSLRLWVNDILMALFFFVVGLEIKHEIVNGELRDPKVAALPVVAAAGGMIVPASIYLLLNAGGAGSSGWGVPMATDIAFAVGVLALLGDRAPQRLKLFLLTLAIADDIGAIVVIAIFYSSGFSPVWFVCAAVGLVGMYLLRRYRVWYVPVYSILGIFIWYATFRSGVHATIAGVAIGMLAPARPLLGQRPLEGIEEVLSGADPQNDPLSTIREVNWRTRETVPITVRMTGLLSPWTSFMIVPIFALANAGVKLSGGAISGAVGSSVTWGVILGLVIGKPVGITLFSLLAIRTKVATMPENTSVGQIFGVGAVAGIGFTVALFVSQLAFADRGLADEATMGILAASLLAVVVGVVTLRILGAKPAPAVPAPEVEVPVPASR